ncbi:MAG: AsmA family protein, partial [Desulforhopalus sp.]
MKPLMKIAGWSAAGFIGLVIVCVVVIKSISDDQYKKWVIDAASSATGRQLAFDGDFNIHLGKDITLKAKDIRLANAEKGTRPDMITVDRLLLKVALLPILRGVLDFVVEIDSPDILLETNADGRGNWVFADPTLEEAEPEQKNQEPAGSFALPLKPYIRNFEITNLQFAFHDKVASDKHISADIDTLKIFVDGNEIPLTLKAAYNGAPIELSGILGRIDDLHANRITDTSLDGKLNEANLTIAGTIGPLAPKLNANLDLLLKADTVSTFSPFAGISLPDLQELDISLTAHATEGKFAAEDIKILVNDDSLHLNVAGNIGDLSEGAGIRLTTEINSENLDTILDQMGIKPLSGLPASLSIEGVATGSLKVLALDSLNVVVKDEGLAMNITGKATNLLAPAGVDVNITATIDTVARISKFAGTEIPDLGALDLKGQI